MNVMNINNGKGWSLQEKADNQTRGYEGTPVISDGGILFALFLKLTTDENVNISWWKTTLSQAAMHNYRTWPYTESDYGSTYLSAIDTDSPRFQTGLFLCPTWRCPGLNMGRPAAKTDTIPLSYSPFLNYIWNYTGHNWHNKNTKIQRKGRWSFSKSKQPFTWWNVFKGECDYLGSLGDLLALVILGDFFAAQSSLSSISLESEQLQLSITVEIKLFP